MKKLLIGLTFIVTSSAFAAAMPWANQIHHAGWLGFDSCRENMLTAIQITDNEANKADLIKALAIIYEVRGAQTDVRLQELLADMDVAEDVTVTDVAVEVFRADLNRDLCYAGEIHGYGVLKHIVENNLSN